jgi:hypothetical protein
MKLAPILSSVLLLAQSPALASVLPTSVSVRWSVGKEARSGGPDLTHEPSLSLTWPLDHRFALWSDIGYIRETTGPRVARTLGSTGYDPFIRHESADYQTHFVPVTLGARVYLQRGLERSRGLYLEAGPTVTLASYMTEERDSQVALLGGFRTGLGVRFDGFDGSLVEAGMTYYLAEAFGEHPDAVGLIGTSGEADVRVFGGYIAIGFGH